jgi:exonuclease VII small subunit
MNNPNGRLVPGHRAVPRGYYEGQIHELNRRIKELENKVDELQERIDQYEWAMGIGE